MRQPQAGPYSRDGFLRAVSEDLETPKQTGAVVLLVARLDGGTHPADPGDEFSDLLASSVRKTDIVGRLGEQEYAVLAADAAEPSAAILKNRVEARIRMRNQAAGSPGELRATIAVRFFRRAEARSIGEMLEMCGVKPPGAGGPGVILPG